MGKLGSLRDSEAFGPWLARIARNRAHDHHRRGHVLVELPDELASPQNIEKSGDAERALAALRRLPETYREAMILRLVEGLSGPEIAAGTGRSPGSVRVHLHRGMKLLREELGWEPLYKDFAAGLAATIAWYRDNEPWWRAKKLETEMKYERLGR
jgi:RNA polymerase sigma factor (sigma-70 family)